MKLSTFLMTLLVVGAVFYVFAAMIDESNTNLGTDINSSAWKDKYDYASNIQNLTAPIETKLKVLDSDEAWYSKIAAGLSAVPYALITFVIGMFAGFSIGGTMATGFLTAFAIPSYIIGVVIIMIVTWGITKLIEAIYRWYL
jgi:hypothetical protein